MGADKEFQNVNKQRTSNICWKARIHTKHHDNGNAEAKSEKNASTILSREHSEILISSLKSDTFSAMQKKCAVYIKRLE